MSHCQRCCSAGGSPVAGAWGRAGAAPARFPQAGPPGACGAVSWGVSPAQTPLMTPLHTGNHIISVLYGTTLNRSHTAPVPERTSRYHPLDSKMLMPRDIRHTQSKDLCWTEEDLKEWDSTGLDRSFMLGFKSSSPASSTSWSLCQSASQNPSSRVSTSSGRVNLQPSQGCQRSTAMSAVSDPGAGL